MKTDIAPFEDFLTSLSGMTHFCFEIWEKGALLYSTAVSDDKGIPIEVAKNLSEEIIKTGEGRNTNYNGLPDAIVGVPINLGSETVCTLIAHGVNHRETPSQEEDQSEPDCESVMNESVMNESVMNQEFLGKLAELIEDSWMNTAQADDLAEELNRSFENLHFYSHITNKIKPLRFSESMLQDLCDEINEILRMDLTFAQLHSQQNYQVITHNTEVTERIPQIKPFVYHLFENIQDDKSVVEEGCIHISDSLNHDPYKDLCPDSYRFLAVPVKHKEGSYGWLGMLSFNLEEIFRRSELRLMMSVAEQLALVISNTELFEDLERFVVNMVNSLISAIEAKDKYTRGHSERVSRYCTIMGRTMGLTVEEQKDLLWASILHDVGKIGIPESILNKKGRLTDDEYRQIQKHPTKGCDILEPIEQFSELRHYILHHHERIDGNGYPHGLEGKQIPVLSRIIAVADTFDALTSDRAYRKALSFAGAFEVLEDVAGTQLDSDIVVSFKKALWEDFGSKGDEK